MASKKNIFEISAVLFILILFILIRSINFSGHLNFSSDQGSGSTKILEIWRNKEFTLVGPGTSLVAHGKQILQGSINYYFPLVFLLLGGFDPLLSSYFFMLFAAFMLFPLYYGVKNFTNQTVALFIGVIYAFLPYFVDFTRFFFGPNYQLSLTAILIFFMGLFKKSGRKIYLFLIFFTAGVLLQFHYQYLIVILILFVFYLSILKDKPRSLFIIALALTLGYLPMIIFELKNDFYNTRVFLEFLPTPKKPTDTALLPHRLLSITLILFILFSNYIRKIITKRFVFFFGAILICIDLLFYLPKPTHGFGMVYDWNLLYEKRVYEIIRAEKLENYNIVNQGYDNLAIVQKYFLKKDNIKINYDDYYNNKYLFVITRNKNFMDDPAYEVATFKPSKILKTWRINQAFVLYLLERLE